MLIAGRPVQNRKLQLKDQIARVEDALLPDITA